MQKILIVDDERTIADTLALILRRSGYRAEAVYNGEEALAYLERENADLVISDVVMPGMNGVDLALLIRQAYSTQVLLISGNANTGDLLQRARIAGHTFTLLAKPIHPTTLLSHVSELLTLASAADVHRAAA